ncbi:hypothetical protein [Acinetobacter soli]|uniref:hypothetical protein n=1 Tax=Acinetobacter soli TaxID=487316 RepID=UPI001D0A31BF|nr:hypothetical protein [Acinetobacter soli]MCB8769540.1 hypothetical protein [Acinetobacter soli]
MHEITREDTFLQTLQIRFGGQFQKRYANQNAQVMRAVIAESLKKMTDAQFNEGMARVNASRFCPDLAEFESWCIAGSWQTVQEAWQRACDWSNLPDYELKNLSELTPEEFLKSKNKITVLTKKAWDSVYWLVEQGDMKSAFSQFKNLYEDYMAKAQALGKQQEWYVPPKMIGTTAFKGIPKTYQPKVDDEKQKIANLTNQLMQSGKSYKEAFQAAQMQIRGYVGSINKMDRMVGKQGGAA